MSEVMLTEISELTTTVLGAGDDPAAPTGLIRDAAVLIRDGRIVWTGPTPTPTPTSGETASAGRNSGPQPQSRPADAVSPEVSGGRGGRGRGGGEREKDAKEERA